MKNKIILSVIIALGFIIQINAQSGFRNSCRPPHTKQERFRDGFRDGEITRQEARQLSREQRALRHAKKRAMADGRISKSERKQLRQMKRQQNRNLYHQKHDRQRRNF